MTFGKAGTKGRETIKEFADENECIKESEKLIAQKIKERLHRNSGKRGGS
ncbi:WGR domain-containing protein [Chryseobacterium sp. W4I1]|nr:WGR domain-containing protein [Chryseobacterium sp. W4I1]